MTVIAIDPGISTGVAIKTKAIQERHDRPELPDLVDPWYIMLVVTEPVKLWDLIKSHKPEVIVCENFASGGLISKDGQATIRLVGAMELAAYITGATLVLQAPQERHRFIEPARDMIRQRGKTPISHEVDALAHLLLYEWRMESGHKAGIRRQTWK